MNKQNQSARKGRKKKKVTKNLHIDKASSNSQRLITSILFLADHESEGGKKTLKKRGDGGRVGWDGVAV